MTAPGYPLSFYSSCSLSPSLSLVVHAETRPSPASVYPKMTTAPGFAARLLLLAVVLAGLSSAASFQTSFANVTQGRSLGLTWDPIDAKYYPLALSARLINRTAENKVNGVLLNLTSASLFLLPADLE